MKLFYSFAVILLFFPFFTFAQNDTIKTILNEVVVTATRTETPYYSLGSSVTVITSKDISQKHFNTVVEVLREVPGLSITQQGGPGKLSNVFVRGTFPYHTLVILDGIVMNDASSPSNSFDFSALNTIDIDRIEIVRGPQSTLYGSDAIAGVINIITKNGTDKPQYTFLGEGGSNGYFRGNLSALGNYGNFYYAINATRNGSKGVSASNSKFGNTEKDGYTNNFFSSRFGINIFQNANINLIYKFTKAKTSLDQNEKFGDDPNYTYNSEEQLFKAGFNISFFDGNWQQQFHASLIKRLGNSFDLVDQLRPNTSSDSYNKSQRVKFDWQNNLRLLDNHLITFGIETATETANTSYYSTSDWGPFETIFPEQSIRTTGVYLQDQLKIANALFTTISARYDNNQKFGDVTTFRIATAYYIHSTGTKIKMSYGTGFKAPSLFYLFDPAFGNPDLKPEKSKGLDFGFEQYFENGKISFGATYFKIQLENMFWFDSNFRSVNFAKASTQGLELTAAALNINNFSFTTAYTFTETKDEYELSTDFNKPLLRRPKHQLSLNISYGFNEKLNTNFQLHFVGDRDDKDFTTIPATRVNLPDYTLFNLDASYKLFNYLKLTTRIENLFDKQYEEVLYYGTLGRSLYIGAQLNF